MSQIRLGYVIVPAGQKSSEYKSSCYRNSTISVYVDGGGFPIHNVKVPYHIMKYIKFPETKNQLGSSVVMVSPHPSYYPIVIGILLPNDDSQNDTPNSDNYSFLDSLGSVGMSYDRLTKQLDLFSLSGDNNGINVSSSNMAGNAYIGLNSNQISINDDSFTHISKESHSVFTYPDDGNNITGTTFGSGISMVEEQMDLFAKDTLTLQTTDSKAPLPLVTNTIQLNNSGSTKMYAKDNLYAYTGTTLLSTTEFQMDNSSKSCTLRADKQIMIKTDESKLSNTTITMKQGSDGSISIQTNGKINIVSGKNACSIEFSKSGDISISANGNNSVQIKKNSEIEVQGNVTLKVKGKVDANISGDLSAEVKGKTTIKSSGKTTIDCSDTNITGNVKIDKDVEISGKLDVTKDTSIKGKVDITKDLSVTGKSSLTQDVEIKTGKLEVKVGKTTLKQLSAGMAGKLDVM